MAQKPSQPTYSDQDVQDVADTIIKNPGVPVDTTNFPDGMSDAVVNEVNLRQQHHQDIQDALNKQTKDQATKANDQPSIMDPGSDKQSMAGLLGVNDALTLGHTDELAGLIGAIDGNGYEPVRDAVRQKQDWAKEHYPKTYYGTNLAYSTRLPIPKGAGFAAGAVAGEGYSKKSLDPRMADPDKSAMPDALTGGAFGGATEAGLGAAGAVAKKGLSQLAKNMDSSFWDPVLLRALFPGKGGSDEVTTLMSRDAMPSQAASGPGGKEVTDVVRATAKFPYLSPQSTKDAIEVPANAMGARGTMMNPIENVPPSPVMNDFVDAQELPPHVAQKGGGWTPQSGAPGEIDLGTTPNGWVNKNGGKTPAQSLYENASTQDLNGLMSNGPAAKVPGRSVPVSRQPAPVNTTLDMGEVPPEAPPLSPAQRVATRGLANMSDAPSNGMDPSSMLGGMSRMVQKNVVGPTAIGIPKAGQAMLRYLDSNPGDYGTKAAMLKGVINHVMSSTDPSFSDYLAKETFPEYLALSMKAEKDNPQESNKPSDTPQQKGFGQSR